MDTTGSRPNGGDDDVVEGYLLVLSGRAWGIALGLLLGVGLFIATNVLLLRGGETVGAHLSLLCQYLPGYDVSFFGSLIGFVYAFLIGYLVGRVACLVYNRIARR